MHAFKAIKRQNNRTHFAVSLVPYAPNSSQAPTRAPASEHRVSTKLVQGNARNEFRRERPAVAADGCDSLIGCPDTCALRPFSRSVSAEGLCASCTVMHSIVSVCDPLVGGKLQYAVRLLHVCCMRIERALHTSLASALLAIGGDFSKTALERCSFPKSAARMAHR